MGGSVFCPHSLSLSLFRPLSLESICLSLSLSVSICLSLSLSVSLFRPSLTHLSLSLPPLSPLSLSSSPAWTSTPPSFHSSSLAHDGDDDSTAAAEVLEALLHDLSAKLTFPTVLPLVTQLLSSADWRSKRAGLEALGRTASASPVSFSPYLPTTVAAALSCCADGNVRVQFQALHLLGAVCNRAVAEAPDSVQALHGGAIVAAVSSLVASPEIKVAAAACEVVVSFCRGSSTASVLPPSSIAPFLPPLLSAISSGVLARMGECEKEGVCVLAVAGINAVACVADAAQEHFQQHYEAFMPGLLQCMTMNLSPSTCSPLSRSLEENGCAMVRGAAMEAAAIVGGAVGGRDFGRFVTDAEKIMQLVMTLLAKANEQYRAEKEAATANVDCASTPLPISMEKLQRSAARISGMMEEAFAQFLPAVLPHLLRQAKQKNEMTVVDGDANGLDASNQGAVERDADAGTETLTMKIPGVGIKKLTMNTSVIQEKADAARAVAEHASALGAHFAPYSKVTVTSLLPLVSFQYSADVRVAGAQALAPAFDAACCLAVDPEHTCYGKVPGADKLPQQLFGSIVNTLVKQLEEERGEPETLVELASAVSDVCRSAYVNTFEEVAGMHVARLDLNEARSLVTKLTGLVGDCLERRRRLFEGMERCGDDEDERDEYEEALNAESDILTPLVDGIGYTLKSGGGTKFVPVFEAVLAPTFGKLLVTAGNPDTRARLSAVCLFDDAVEHLGPTAAHAHGATLLPGVLEGMDDAKNGGDVDLKQASVYGVAQLARRAPDVLHPVAGEVAGRLYEIVGKGAEEGEGEEAMVENAVSALGSMCVFRGCPFPTVVGGEAAREAVKELVLNSLPLAEDEEEAQACHDRFADMVEVGDGSCVGTPEQLARTMTIMASVTTSVASGDEVASPSTLARFAGLFGKLQASPHAQAAWALLDGESQGVIGKVIQSEAGARGLNTVTP